MKHKIVDLRGRESEVECIACAIQSGKVANPGLIAQTEYFSAEQDFEFPIPGFVILASKRHLKSVDEFSEDEQQDFMKFLVRLRSAMRKELEIEHITLVQEENTTTSHFHFWLFPHYQWMNEKFGKKIEAIQTIMEYARANLKTASNLKAVDEATQKLKDKLQN
ncbi:MAG: HIT domain-containing protein [Candidatus Moraniibacteriota bacterium]